MYMGHDLSPFDQGESDVFGADFSKHPHMAAGDIIVGAVWACSVADDSPLPDLNAANCIIGNAQFSGATTQQRVASTTAGVKYVITATVQTLQGNTLSLWSYMTCTKPE